MDKHERKLLFIPIVWKSIGTFLILFVEMWW